VREREIQRLVVTLALFIVSIFCVHGAYVDGVLFFPPRVNIKATKYEVDPSSDCALKDSKKLDKNTDPLELHLSKRKSAAEVSFYFHFIFSV
jgi:hypothetical protein